jgi:hypothetical protein
MKNSTILQLVHQLKSDENGKPLEVRVGVEVPSICPRCGGKGLHRHGVLARR